MKNVERRQTALHLWEKEMLSEGSIVCEEDKINSLCPHPANVEKVSMVSKEDVDMIQGWTCLGEGELEEKMLLGLVLVRQCAAHWVTETTRQTSLLQAE